MFGALAVIAVAVAAAFAASYVMWRAASKSGLWALVAGVVLGAIAFVLAVLIGLAMTSAWFRI